MSTYTAKDITVLEGLEPVRKRPGMYIGGVGTAGLHHLVWEMLDNAVDEAMNGYASNICRHAARGRQLDHRRDDGRGIPGGQASGDEEERAGSDLHRAPCRRKIRAGQLQDRRRLHGVGASVVNALSTELRASVSARARCGRCRSSAASRPGR